MLGGIGNLRGAFIGGIIMGLIEVGARAYLCPWLQISGGYAVAFAFAILIGVILVRPTGILGTQGCFHRAADASGGINTGTLSLVRKTDKIGIDRKSTRLNSSHT